MTYEENNPNKVFILVLVWLALWAVLFEFILPANRFLPAPSLLIEAFGSLWTDYNLGINIISTISVVYLSLIISFFLIWMLKSVFLKGSGFIFNLLTSIEWFSEYIPGIIIGILLIFWFPQSDYTEFIFALSVAFTSQSLTLIKLKKRINKGYTDAAVSLGLQENQINEIKFNSVLPSFTSAFFELHFYVWTMLLIFEFINEAYGIGFILKQALEYKDIGAFAAASLITGVLIYLGTLTLKFIKTRFFFWK